MLSLTHPQGLCPAPGIGFVPLDPDLSELLLWALQGLLNLNGFPSQWKAYFPPF